MLIINFEGSEAKGLLEGRYDETFAGEDDAQADLSLCWSHIPHCWKSHVAAQILNKMGILIRPSKKLPVLRVTGPYLNLLMKSRNFFRISGKI